MKIEGYQISSMQIICFKWFKLARYRAGVAELVLEDYVLWKFIYNPFDDPYFILFYFILFYRILFYFILFYFSYLILFDITFFILYSFL